MRSRRLTVPLSALLLLSGCALMDAVSVSPPPPKRARDAGQPPAAAAALDDRLDQVNQRLDQVDGRVQSLEGGVASAQGRADEAARKADAVNSRLTRLWTNRFNQQAASSFEVYFSPDSIDLSDAAQTALGWVAKEMEEHPSLTVELGGYSDPRGSLDYNYALSQRRVEAVKRFLMDRGIQLGRIQSASLGPITNAGIPDAKKRRVTVRMMADRE